MPIEPNKEFIPEAIDQIVTFLEDIAIGEYDLFRFCTSPDVVDLKRHIDNGDLPLKLNKESIQSVTGVLILYFRELPEPLLTFALYDEFVQSIEFEGQERLKRTASLLARIPLGNYSFLNFILLFFWKVKEFSVTNGVTSTTLGVIFGPYILSSSQDFSSQSYSNVSNDVVTWLIDHYPLVFDVTAPYLPNSIKTKKKLEALKNIKTGKKSGSQSISLRKGRETIKSHFQTSASTSKASGQSHHEGAASLFENVQEELYLSVVQPKKVSFPLDQSNSRQRKMTTPLPPTQTLRPAPLLPVASAIELPRINHDDFEYPSRVSHTTTTSSFSSPFQETCSGPLERQHVEDFSASVSEADGNHPLTEQRETLIRILSDLDEMEGILDQIEPGR